jgi:hypothetical protein
MIPLQLNRQCIYYIRLSENSCKNSMRQTLGGCKVHKQTKSDAGYVRKVKEEVGGDLLSHTVSSAVPSVLVGLTTGFGMGPGVPPQL